VSAGRLEKTSSDGLEKLGRIGSDRKKVDPIHFDLVQSDLIWPTLVQDLFELLETL
jgi:hypothetical protein